jgi:hypothetical protein
MFLILEGFCFNAKCVPGFGPRGETSLLRGAPTPFGEYFIVSRDGAQDPIFLLSSFITVKKNQN